MPNPAGKYKILRSQDPDFCFSPDGLTMVNRAGFEITDKCPIEYKRIIQHCYQKGWIEPVAYMRDIEYTMELLKK
jgi:hypothetical protein